MVAVFSLAANVLLLLLLARQIDKSRQLQEITESEDAYRSGTSLTRYGGTSKRIRDIFSKDP